jgi:hypothetical protein
MPKIITEEDLVFTDTELTKIEELRRQRSVNNYNNKTSTWTPRPGLKEGSPVHISYDGTNMIGTILKIYRENAWNILYDVSTPGGIMKKVSRVWARTVQDLSGVVIPEALKKMNTGQLLSLLQSTRLWNEYDEEEYHAPYYSPDVLKAELANRPHVFNKKERKALRKNKQRNKK